MLPSKHYDVRETRSNRPETGAHLELVDGVPKARLTSRNFTSIRLVKADSTPPGARCQCFDRGQDFLECSGAQYISANPANETRYGHTYEDGQHARLDHVAPFRWRARHIGGRGDRFVRSCSGDRRYDWRAFCSRHDSRARSVSGIRRVEAGM